MRYTDTMSLKRHLTQTALFVSTFLAAATPVSAQTLNWSGVCVGGGDNDVATLQGLECMLANVFIVFISIIGLAAFVMFIVGAFRWMLSGGDSKGTSKARGTITYAVVGIVVALSAYIILNMISSFTSVDIITQFTIPDSNELSNTGGSL